MLKTLLFFCELDYALNTVSVWLPACACTHLSA